jgi:hypothetical protein
LFNPLTGPRLLDEVEALLPEHRERLFPPTETLSMFLAQALLDAGQAETWRNVRFDIDQGRSERLGSALRLANTEIKQNDIRPSTRRRKVDWRRAHQRG